MTQETDVDTIDFKIGEMSGTALAKIDASLTDEQVVASGIEAFENLKVGVSGTPLSQVLNRSLFSYGHLRGYRNYLGGLI